MGYDAVRDAERAKLELAGSDIVDTAQASQILGLPSTRISVMVRTGYLPAVRGPQGSGLWPCLFDRAVVEHLARRRAEAQRWARWLRWGKPHPEVRAELAAVAAQSRMGAAS